MEHSNTTVSSGESELSHSICVCMPFSYSIRKSGCGLLPANGIWQGAGTPATSQMRCWLLRRHKLHIPRPAASGRSRPFRCASSQNRNRVAGLRFCVFCARWRNVGFFRCAAHTPAVCPENRTQRRHAPHGAVQALGAPAGSIVPTFFTGGKSALSARLSEIHRLPLLR